MQDHLGGTADVFKVCVQLEEDIARKKAKAGNSLDIFCILGGLGKQPCWELQFILERIGVTLGRWVKRNLSSKTSEEETPNLDP